MKSKHQKEADANKFLPKPLRIEKKMVHGQLVEVKIYASPKVIDAKVTARAKLARNAAK